MVERGPYGFKEYYWKFDISWHDDGNVVEYLSQKYYIFDPDSTDPGLSMDDELTLPYVTFIGFQYLLSTIPASATVLLEQFMEVKPKLAFTNYFLIIISGAFN